ncbi:pre-pilin like leader sequence [Lysobacteraceae bacterium NML07-0707]|nr:pre-pilin like leader sequence [Xanthomonadaceae bacterium NML07-0707]
MKDKGFTLVELMVTLAVLGVLVSVGYPSFQGVIRSNRVATTTNELVASVALARSTAIRTSLGAGICKSNDQNSCGGDGVSWNDGWLVWEDSNLNGKKDSGETILSYTQGRSNLQVDGPASEGITFDGRGRRRNAADQQLSIQPEDCQATEQLRQVLTVNYSGQVRSKKSACVP